MRSNPAIYKLGNMPRQEERSATYNGIILKTLYFALATLIPAVISYMLSFSITSSSVLIALVSVSPIIALISGLVAVFVPRAIPVAGTIYTVFQGLSLGFISAIVGSIYGGIVFMALVSTFLTLAVMGLLYKVKAIRVGSFFRRFMINALVAIMVSQLVIWLISLFSPAVANAFYGNTVLSLIISVGMTIFAALMLLFDFSNMTMIVENGMDKSNEWYGAFGLITTLIWMYIQFLRLFMILMNRRR